MSTCAVLDVGYRRIRTLALSLWLLAALSLIYGSYLVYEADKQGLVIAWEPGDCHAVRWSNAGKLVVGCNDGEYAVDDRAVLDSYLLNRGPLLCAISMGGQITCVPRSFPT